MCVCVTQFVLQISNTGTELNHQFIPDKCHAIRKHHYGKVGTKQITKFTVLDLYSTLPRFFYKEKKVGGKWTSQIHAATIYSYVTKLKM